MREIEDLLQQRLDSSRTEIENRVAWFYAYFLSGPPPEGQNEEMIITASTILFPRDYAVLSKPKGKREAAALKRSSLLKKDYLRAQLRDIIETYAECLRMRKEEIPEGLRQKLDNKLDEYTEKTSRELSKEVQRCFLQGYPVRTTTKKLTAIFKKEASSLNNYAAYCYEQAGWVQALEAQTKQGKGAFIFVSEEGENTCKRCAELNGKRFDLEEIVDQEIYPPLHPHCRCALIPSEGVNSGKPEGVGQGRWYESILKNMTDIPSDALKMIEGYLQAQQGRWDNGKYLDWMTMGSVSGFWKGIESRSQAMMESPSVYSIANWLTLGLLDLGKGAIDPERPLSLEHWLDSLGFASALYGMSEAAKQALAIHKSRTISSETIEYDRSPVQVDGGDKTWSEDSFRKSADPFRDIMGPGIESHPEQWDAIINEMKQKGVEIVYRKGTMAYSPMKEYAGQLIVDPDASFSALLHEYMHYLDDAALGFPGKEYHYQTINRVKMELHAYMQEIKLADSLGYKEVANQLFDNYRAERKLLASHLK